MPHIRPLHEIGRTNERHSPAFRAIVEAGNFLFTEFRQATSVVACLQLAAVNEQAAIALDHQGQKRGNEPSTRFQSAVNWARQLHGEQFHPVYASSVLAMWAVIEASVEDIFATLLEMSKQVSETAVSYLKPGKFPIEGWPWTDDARVEIAKQLQNKAKKLPTGSDRDVFLRLKTMFGWIGVNIELNESSVKLFNEIVLIRNIMVHRNGRISEADIAQAEGLKKFQSSGLRIDNVHFALYGTTLISFHSALAEAVFAFEAQRSGFTRSPNRTFT